MRNITIQDIDYSLIFRYKELKYIYDFYKKNKNKFKNQYNQLKVYICRYKPSVKYIFIGAFLRVNENDIEDLSEMYVFIEIPNVSLTNNAYIFFNSLIVFHDTFVENININTLDILSNITFIEQNKEFNKIILEFKKQELEILAFY